MIATNGHNHGSFLWGSSTRNSRIERLWVEVGTQFVRRWRGFFTRLEQLHKLDVDKPGHLWLLSMLFLNALNDDCRQFQQEWNLHPIHGSDTRDRSPQDMRLLGQASLGIYEDEFEGICPTVLQRYYGIHGREVVCHRNQTGAGHPSDEADEPAEDDIIDRIEQEQANDVQHDAVEVPDSNTPFRNEEDESMFFEILEAVVMEGIVPEGYNLREGEDEYDENTILYKIRRDPGPLYTNSAPRRLICVPVLSSISLRMPKPAFCKGNPDESVPCYCEEYSAPTNIPVGQKELCAECLHGKSKHPRPQPPVLPVAELPAVTTAKERAGVTAIFKQSLARRAGQGSQNTTTVTAARDEVMAGFRPTAKQKFPGRIVSSRQASSSKQGHVPIKVGAIAVLVNYLDDKGELLTTILPVKTEMSKFKRRGCAHFDGDQSEDGGSVDFSFCLDWTFEEVDAYIRRLFPKVFEYLDSVKVGDVKGKATDNGASEWVLISKENCRLSVAPEPFPTGKHLEWYKGRSNAPLQQTNIFIGIRKFIPEHTYARWDPDMVIIDIADDSDDGDDGDDNNHKQEYGPGLKIEDDVFTQVPKIVRPKRPMQRGTCQEPAQKKMRGTHGRPIASKTGNKSGRSSGKVELFCSSDSDTDNSLNALPASLKGMSISPLTQKRAPCHNPMMPLIKDEEHQDIDLQDFAKAQTHVSAMPLPNRPLFQPLVSVQPTLNDLLRGHPDVNDPLSRPFHNPWTTDYFIGSIKLWL
ncbi:uncharacterized protein F5891DRAFT_975775 [Suillus fuscotomentosus]|uniref:Integrase core domain-containing protein n=1 Tax=Suillus fuscotomentosus TaxID=1912939 RepID=A0AAD4EHL9_9AGAM|nr:uncharacterized protein F5891DRAFT_975775 [Suillus fuscotomentosus]KAG1906383.1 hypothetical protein F5891DRAFT_975775 [Suillus fuscotomentosus]